MWWRAARAVVRPEIVHRADLRMVFAFPIAGRSTTQSPKLLFGRAHWITPSWSSKILSRLLGVLILWKHQRRGNIFLRTDEIADLRRVAARHPLHFAAAHRFGLVFVSFQCIRYHSIGKRQQSTTAVVTAYEPSNHNQCSGTFQVQDRQCLPPVLQAIFEDANLTDAGIRMTRRGQRRIPRLT